MDEKQKPRGWGLPSLGKLLGWLASPIGALAGFPGLGKLPRWLAWPIRVLVAALLVFLLYMIELGLLAFFRLGNEIAFGPLAVSTSGSLTVFFSALAALIGGPLVIWRVITAHVQAQAARRQAAIAQEGYYTGLFTKAVELLGATREVKKTVEVEGKRELVTDTEPNLEVRLGAIYAVERIARDSERDHWPIMEVLCAYIRNPQNSGLPVPVPKGASPGNEGFWHWRDSLPRLRVDVQAALTVIGRRRADRIAYEAAQGLKLDFSGANLQRGVFDWGNFSRANFMRAHLNACYIQFAVFDGAHFDLAHLEAAIMDDASLNRTSFLKAHLDGTSFTGSALRGADFAHAIFNRATFGGTILNGSTFENATFCTDPHFHDADLRGAIFFGADLQHALSLTIDDVAASLGDLTTMLPATIRKPLDWPDRELDRAEREKWILTPRPPVQTAVPTQTVPAPNRSINCKSLGAGNAVYTNCY